MSHTLNIPDTDSERIIILGAGFAGLRVARKLRNSRYQIVLLDRNNYHQFQPLYYQVAMAGLEPSSISFPLRKLFQKNTNVIIRTAEVTGIDTKAKEVKLGNKRLPYDHVVIALGAKTNYFGNKEIEEKSLSLKTVSEALYMRNSLLGDYEDAVQTDNYDNRQGLIDTVIVGGGPTGVELAGSLAEMKKYILPRDYKELDTEEVDIYLIQGAPQLLMGMSDKASGDALKFLQGLGVNVKLNTRVDRYDGETAYLSDGSTIPTKKLIWAAGVTCPRIDGIDESSLGRANRIKINAHHQVLQHPDLYAIGDIAYLEDTDYPAGHPQVAQVAIQMADNLVKNFKRKEKNKSLKDFKYKDLGSMATIGRNKAVCDLPKWKTTGFIAWVIWLFVHLFQLIGVRNKVIVFINWVWNYITYDQSLRIIIKPHRSARDE